MLRVLVFENPYARILTQGICSVVRMMFDWGVREAGLITRMNGGKNFEVGGAAITKSIAARPFNAG